MTHKLTSVKVALVVGHTPKARGATNVKHYENEFDFNKRMAAKIKVEVEYQSDIEVEIVYRDTYRDLPDKLNTLNPDFIISLHCNAYNTEASGTEVLYYYGSRNGKMMADIVHNNILRALELPRRGSKPKGSEDRGGYLLRYTQAPCVIAEPFFIDNDDDLERVAERFSELVGAFSYSIIEIAKKF